MQNSKQWTDNTRHTTGGSHSGGNAPLQAVDLLQRQIPCGIVPDIRRCPYREEDERMVNLEYRYQTTSWQNGV